MGRDHAMVTTGDVFVIILAMGGRSLVLLLDLFIYLSQTGTRHSVPSRRTACGLGREWGVSIYVQCAIHFSPFNHSVFAMHCLHCIQLHLVIRVCFAQIVYAVAD